MTLPGRLSSAGEVVDRALRGLPDLVDDLENAYEALITDLEGRLEERDATIEGLERELAALKSALPGWVE